MHSYIKNKIYAYFPKIAWHKSWQKYMILKIAKKKKTLACISSSIATNILQKK